MGLGLRFVQFGIFLCFRSYEEKGLSCRTNQIQYEAKTKSGDKVFCCRYSSTSNLVVPKAIAHECVFKGENLLSWSGHTPGSDLICKDPENFEIVNIKTQHVVYKKMVTLSCCKKIETTTTTTTTTTPPPTSEKIRIFLIFFYFSIFL